MLTDCFSCYSKYTPFKEDKNYRNLKIRGIQTLVFIHFRKKTKVLTVLINKKHEAST